MIRLATYNVEWFNALFDDAGRLMADDAPSARHATSRAAQVAALGVVFTALDADAILIVEAPDQGHRRRTVPALEGFAAHFGLRARRALIGYPSETEQEIAFLFDPDRITARHDPQGDAAVPPFDGSFRHDLDSDGVGDVVRFDKPPLEIALEAEGLALRLIGVHAKSKSPHGARNANDATRLAIDNRRKQLAQCLWVRARAEAVMTAGDPLIVLGDFNDGPGLDEFEALFGRSGVEIVLGQDGPAPLRLNDPHAEMALVRRIGVAPTTARFWLGPQRRYFEALLDFIMVSPGLAAKGPVWRIWHPLNDPAVVATPGLAAALLTASDHFPVTLDL